MIYRKRQSLGYGRTTIANAELLGFALLFKLTKGGAWHIKTGTEDAQRLKLF